MNFITTTDLSVDNRDASAANEYTRSHREAWPLLVRNRGADRVAPANRLAWMALWGSLGASLFDCFWGGDRFVRADMISRARSLGGWRGASLASRLEFAIAILQWTNSHSDSSLIINSQDTGRRCATD